jgi:hypothetical protein
MGAGDAASTLPYWQQSPMTSIALVVSRFAGGIAVP